MFLKKYFSSLVLVFCALIRENDAGCKYTNPQWIGDDPSFMTAPSLHLTFNGVNEEDQVWLSASWNISYVEKYPQCIDNVQVLVKKIKDSKTKKTLLCDLVKPTISNCTGALTRKDFCDETLDIWIRITNGDYKDGLQPIGAPSMTRIDNFQCGEPYTLETLGTFVKSQSCESLQPTIRSSPEFIIPEGIRGKRVINMTWTNKLIENVICVDEVEVKYWEEGEFSKGYHKESVKITNPGSEDFEYMLELDVTVCKTYSYMLKAMKTEPYFVATFEGKFSSKCDETLLSQQQSTTAKTAKTKTKTTTATSTTTTEMTDEPTSSVETKELSSTSEADETSVASEASSASETSSTVEASEASETSSTVDASEASSASEASETSEATSTTAEEEHKETTAAEASETTSSEDEKKTTTSVDSETSPEMETTKSDVTETTKSDEMKTTSGEFDGKNYLDDPKESVRSNVDPSSFTVPGETTLSTTLSANNSTEIELNTSIITLSTSELESSSNSDHQTETETHSEDEDGKLNMAITEMEGSENNETTVGQTMSTTVGLEMKEEDKTTMSEMGDGDKEMSRFETVLKEKEVSMSFEVSNETSIEGSMVKRGRILMGDDSDDTVESTRNADQARALQFNPWGKNSAEIQTSHQKSNLLFTALILFSAFLV